MAKKVRRNTRPAQASRLAPSPTVTSKLSPTAVTLLLTVAVLAVYGQIVGFDSVYYDDAEYVFQNPHVNTGLSGPNFLWAFSAGYASNWHPLTWLTHMLDVSIFGLDPRGHHVLNLLLHLANTLLVFRLFRKSTGSLAVGAGVALLFSIHPLRAESVAWIAERKDVLFMFWGLLSIFFYLAWTESRRLVQYIGMLACLALSLMSKSMLVTFPALLLVLDFWPLHRFSLDWAGLREHGPRLLLEKLPVLVLVLGSSVMTLIAQDRGGALQSLHALPIHVRLTNAIVAYVEYIGMMLWPTGLVFDYQHPVGSSSGATVLFCLLVLIVLTVAFWRARTRDPSLLVGWSWYLVTMIPVLGLVQVGYQAMADRYTYFPQVGLSLILVQLCRMLFEAKHAPRKLLLTAFAACSLLLAVLSFNQVRTWRNMDTLMDHALAVTPGNAKVHFGKAIAYHNRGEEEKAMEHLEIAARLAPNYKQVQEEIEIVREAMRRKRRIGN